MQRLQEEIDRLEGQLEKYRIKIFGKDGYENIRRTSADGNATPLASENVLPPRPSDSSGDSIIDGEGSVQIRGACSMGEKYLPSYLANGNIYDRLTATSSVASSHTTKAQCSSQCSHRKEVSRLMLQLREERDENRRLRALRGTTEKKLSSRISCLEERAKVMLERTRTLERRRASDADGWRADISSLRQRLAAAERRQKRLLVFVNMPDDDNRDAALERHLHMERRETRKSSRIEGDSLCPQNQTDFQTCLTSLSQELEGLQHALGQIEERMEAGDKGK